MNTNIMDNLIFVYDVFYINNINIFILKITCIKCIFDFKYKYFLNSGNYYCIQL